LKLDAKHFAPNPRVQPRLAPAVSPRLGSFSVAADYQGRHHGQMGSRRNPSSVEDDLFSAQQPPAERGNCERSKEVSTQQ